MIAFHCSTPSVGEDIKRFGVWLSQRPGVASVILNDFRSSGKRREDGILVSATSSSVQVQLLISGLVYLFYALPQKGKTVAELELLLRPLFIASGKIHSSQWAPITHELRTVLEKEVFRAAPPKATSSPRRPLATPSLKSPPPGMAPRPLEPPPPPAPQVQRESPTMEIPATPVHQISLLRRCVEKLRSIGFRITIGGGKVDAELEL